MSSAPALSLLLAANSLESVLLVVLVILAVLVVIAIVGALLVFMRRRQTDESTAEVISTAPLVPPSPVPGPAPVPPQSGAVDAFASRPPVGPPAAVPPSSPAPPPIVQTTTPTPAPEPPEPVKLEETPREAPPAPTAEEPAPGETPAPPSVSLTQTPEDVDQRSPAELAAAAQAAAAAEEREATDGAQPGVAIQPEVTVGPPRPVVPPAAPDPARLRMLGLTLGMLTERMRREHPPQLGTALARLVDTDQEGARAQLSTLALSLLGEDEESSTGDVQLGLFLEEALEGEIQRGFSISSMPEFQQALAAVAPELHEKLQTIVWARNADSVAILTTEDVEALERVAMAMATALMLDTSYDVRRLPGEAASDRP